MFLLQTRSIWQIVLGGVVYTIADEFFGLQVMSFAKTEKHYFLTHILQPSWRQVTILKIQVLTCEIKQFVRSRCHPTSLFSVYINDINGLMQEVFCDCRLFLLRVMAIL
jgi:hypothetical protein